MKTEIKLLNYKGKMVPFEISYDIKGGDTVWNIVRETFKDQLKN